MGTTMEAMHRSVRGRLRRENCGKRTYLALTTFCHSSRCHLILQGELMLISIGNDFSGFAQLAFYGIPRVNLDLVFCGNKAHCPKAFAAVIGHERMNDVAVIANGI